MTLLDQKIIIRTVALVLLTYLPLNAAAPLFARLSTDRNTIYSGEAFQIVLSIFLTGDTLAPQISIDGLPAPEQLQLYPFQELPIETSTIEGRPYEVRRFKAWARAPKAGQVLLHPKLGGTYIQTTRSFFFMQESRRPTSIPSEPFNLLILPLPSNGQPSDFSGLAGLFTFSATATPLDIALGDLITLTLTVEGDLLPDSYVKPGLIQAPDCKVYELKPLSSDCTPTRHVFTQTVVPTRTSLTALPACSLSYFDTRAGRYKTLTSGPFPLRYHFERPPVQTVYSPTPTALTTRTTTGSGSSVSHPEYIPTQSRFLRWMRSGKYGIINGEEETQVFLAPSDSSKRLFTIKPGVSVFTGAIHENWIYISAPDGMGWIPVTSIRR